MPDFDCLSKMTMPFHHVRQKGEVWIKITVEGDNTKDVNDVINDISMTDWTRDNRSYQLLSLDRQPLEIRSCVSLGVKKTSFKTSEK